MSLESSLTQNLTPELLASLPRSDREQLHRLLTEKLRRQRRRKINTYYPDTGPLRRELYTKSLEFFALGKTHQERLALGGNRTGKTESIGGYETTLHLTGNYPEWWPGRTFPHAVDWWVAGETAKTTRDIQQEKLLGPIDDIGTGLIPGDLIIGEPSKKAGVPDAIDSAQIRHRSGGISRVWFKSYQEGRVAFQGTDMHGVWLDEEAPYAIYTECLLRLMTTQGMLLLTFTPLMGMTETVLAFLPGGKLDEITL